MKCVLVISHKLHVFIKAFNQNAHFFLSEFKLHLLFRQSMICGYEHNWEVGRKQNKGHIFPQATAVFYGNIY